MPELPFVHVLVENLAAQAGGRRITHVRLTSASVLKTYDPPLDAVRGQLIQGIRRVAKLVVLDLSGDLSLVFHLMRNGRLQIVPASQRGNRDLAFALGLDDGREIRCVEIGPKKRAAVYVLRKAGMAAAEPLTGLGIDPLSPEFTEVRLTEMLQAERARLKRFLTLQRDVTGIGNAYSDEILWEAKLSPYAQPARLTPEEISRLYSAIRETLTRALQEHRERFDGELPMREPVDLLRVHRHGGEPCPRCGTKIEEIAYSEKETYYCPRCQTGGKVYADRRMSRLLR